MKVYLLIFSLLFSLSQNFSQKNNFQNYNQKIGGSDYGLEMVSIKGGEFKMGSPNYEKNRMADEGPVHKVYVDSFWMGKFEITWDLYELFMSREIDNKQIINDIKNEVNLDVDALSSATTPYVEMSFGMGVEGYPAISMTQLAASKFCEWLSAMTGNYYRLPTEAEWEYACRAGTENAFSFENADEIEEYAWFENNSNGKYQKVGQKLPNKFGLHDMHGNVSEWTLDQYNEDAYSNVKDTIINNPFNRPTSEYPRVVRGGSWKDSAEDLRSYKKIPSEKSWKRRDPQFPKSRWWHTNAQFLGFRVVRPYNTPNIEDIEAYWIK